MGEEVIAQLEDLARSDSTARETAAVQIRKPRDNDVQT